MKLINVSFLHLELFHCLWYYYIYGTRFIQATESIVSSTGCSDEKSTVNREKKAHSTHGRVIFGVHPIKKYTIFTLEVPSWNAKDLHIQ